MSEEEIMDDIFGGGKWKGNKFWWCDMCDTFSIGCPVKCTGSSCNGGGCPECIELHKDFHKAKTSMTDYLNQSEREVYEKIRWLKKYMKESLEQGEYEINWKRMKQQGHLCKITESMFGAEIEESFKKYSDRDYGDY